MNKKTKIILVLLAFFVVVGIGVAGALERPWDTNDPESIKLEETAQQEKLAPEDWNNLRDNYEQKQKWLNMSDEEKAKIKEKRYSEFLKQKAETASQSPESISKPHLGILKDGVDPFLSGSVFKQTDIAWRGYVDGKIITVVTGVFNSDPLQGIIAVMNGTWNFKPEQYLTPTATGPVRITEIKDGVLTLESIAGKYEVFDINTGMRDQILTPGNEVYYFNLKERRFQ